MRMGVRHYLSCSGTYRYAAANLHMIVNYPTLKYFIFTAKFIHMTGYKGFTPTIDKGIWKKPKYLMATIILYLLNGAFAFLAAQPNTDQILIGKDGIMRWQADGREVTGFGVNYTVPFAHAFRSGKKLGVDLKEAIDADVYQMARLGLDLYRVHVWDCEISDSLGNLLDNEHLDLFDYLLFRLQEHHINAIITPIAYWGNGWPDPNEPTPGFSQKYGKDSCLVDPEAIKAQENYLAQFVNHVNRYTGVSYKYDKKILAFEISNEPHHHGTPDEVTQFVTRMKEAIRSTGCTKPVFYNVSHSIQLAEAYFAAGIDGGTFQWYPTGLGFQKELGGNMLPNVDRYSIPFADLMKKKGAARIVYEFDAADMASTYMYPAMARSFRTAGIQLATHFSYDPTFLAPYNTEYNTHYMNLLYAPGKALSLMICAEVFRQIPLYKDYGAYPDNASFGPFRISYADDLAEMVTSKKFIHTNHTKTKPANAEKLTLIAGRGNSPLIEYNGTGAYFLDKLGDGRWRLEVMPDVVHIRNLFGRNSLDKKVAVLHQQRRQMKIMLPGLEEGFAMESVDRRDSIVYRESNNKIVSVKPGIYLLTSPDDLNADSILLQSDIKFAWKDVVSFPEGETLPVEPFNPQRTTRNSKHTSAESPLSLFNAATDYEWLNLRWLPESGLKKDETSGSSFYEVKIPGLVEEDPEDINRPVIADYTMRHYFGDLIKGREEEVIRKKTLVLNGGTKGSFSFPVQISLVMKDGSAFGGTIQLDPTIKQYRLVLADLKKVQAVLMPRPYPTFLPYYSISGKANSLDLNEIERLQISVGPGIAKEDWGKTYELSVESVLLE
jgi:hypothetical protein